jgi:hypothetical protein
MQHDSLFDRVSATTSALLAYCQENDWAGHDPYDALNSRLLQALPIFQSRVPQIILTQALKRSPIDIRPLALVPKTQNPKALGLFLTGLIKLSAVDGVDRRPEIASLADRLVALRSPQMKYWCWGYSFPWQTRGPVVPRHSPNLVCTTFVANGLLDAYDVSGDSRLLEMAASAARYILNDLFWTDGGSVVGLRYPLPTEESRVHNANLLGAALLCRVHRLTGDRNMLETALKVARYSAANQRPDGSWPYGEMATQSWIDNFHTGYNLSGLRAINEYAGTAEFDDHIRRGFAFYREHFFREDGAPRYFHNQTYPIDVHCVAQSLITLVEFKELHSDGLTQAQAVFDWAMAHMWDRRGFFYYRVLRFGTIRTSYMRWSQAWMFLALSALLHDLSGIAGARQPSPLLSAVHG